MVGERAVARAALRAALAIGLWQANLAAEAGVIRHDRAEQQHRDLANLPAYQAVGQVRAEVNGASALCSGTMIAPDWVLTAAHCLANSTAEGVYYRNQGQTLFASEILVHPQFTGVPSGGNDIGLVRLASASEIWTPAQRLRELIPLGATATMVGFGQTGTGLTGSVPGTHGVKRAGRNVVDVNGLRVMSDGANFYPEHVLFADFDHPDSAADSVWGSAAPLDMEYQTAPGDSGGGWFMHHNGVDQLYAVHSFALAFDGSADNDYGDASAGIRVTRFNSWIDEQLGADYWINPAGGDFSAPTNWSSATAPPGNQTLRFAFPHAYGVEFSGEHEVARLEIARGAPVFSSAGGTLRAHGVHIASGASAQFQLAAPAALQIEGDVSGGGSLGKAGPGELRFTSDATVASFLTIDEGRLTVAADATVALGELRLNDAAPIAIGVEANAELAINAPFEFRANTTINVGDGGRISVPSWWQGGTLEIGGGQLDVTTTVRLTSEASISIDVTGVVLEGAPTPVTVGGDLFLDGGVRLSLDGAPPWDHVWWPKSPREWTILSADGALTGTFANVDLSGLPAGLEFSVTYSEHAVALRLDGIPPEYTIRGDANGDLVVDLDDLNYVRANFGADRGLGDVHGDGVIDLDDLNEVRNHFGERLAPFPRPVPEPTALLLAGATWAALTAMRRRLQ